jgi:hypothetical protein
MTIVFDCPKCGRKIRVRDEASGHRGTCEACGSVLTVPTLPFVAESVEPPALPVASPSTRRQNQTPEIADKNQAPASVTRQITDAAEVVEPVSAQPQSASKSPKLVVDVAEDPQADAAVAGKARSKNAWAYAAFVLAILSLLISWIPSVSLVAIAGISLALLLTVVAFVVSFGRSGDGRLMSIAAGFVSAAAIVFVVVSTSLATATSGAAASAKALADALQAHAIRPQLPDFIPPQQNTKQSDTKQSDAKQAEAAGITRPSPDPPAVAPRRKAPKVSPASGDVPQEDKAESAARRRYSGTLKIARRLAETGNLRGAERAFRRIINSAPGTSIAAEAEKELEALPPH